MSEIKLRSRFALPPRHFNIRAKIEGCEKIEHEQADEINRLKSKVVELKERLRQNSANSNLPPSSDSLFQPPHRRYSPSELKRGAQPGHKGVGRQLLPMLKLIKLLTCAPTAVRLAAVCCLAKIAVRRGDK